MFPSKSCLVPSRLGAGIFTGSVHRLSFLPSHLRPGVNAVVVVDDDADPCFNSFRCVICI